MLPLAESFAILLVWAVASNQSETTKTMAAIGTASVTAESDLYHKDDNRKYRRRLTHHHQTDDKHHKDNQARNAGGCGARA